MAVLCHSLCVVFCSARALCWYVREFASNVISNSNKMTTEWWQLNNDIISSTKLCLRKKMTYGKSTEDRQSTSRAQASITPPVQLVVLRWDSLLSSHEETFWSLMHCLADAWTYAYGLNRIRKISHLSLPIALQFTNNNDNVPVWAGSYFEFTQCHWLHIPFLAGCLTFLHESCLEMRW